MYVTTYCTRFAGPCQQIQVRMTQLVSNVASYGASSDSHSVCSTSADIQPGEMKYHRKLSEDVDMDISAIPEISPTLGLAAGRDRLSATNRSLTKRRPASFRQSLLLDSKEDEIMGKQRVDLTPNKNVRMLVS